MEARDDIKDINIEEQSELKKQIDKFVQQNPDAVAQLLRNWIADDWN
jgi:flagellar M-ring protein FliF